jgi:hypothetical protein
MEGERPSNERLFDDPYATLFDDARLDVQQIFEMVPFFVEHVRIRTRFIDDTVREAVARGVRDVVLIGAGFDTRALRMPELGAPVRVIEMDHAEQIAEKKRRFAAAGITVPQGLVFYRPPDSARLQIRRLCSGYAKGYSGTSRKPPWRPSRRTRPVFPLRAPWWSRIISRNGGVRARWKKCSRPWAGASRRDRPSTHFIADGSGRACHPEASRSR